MIRPASLPQGPEALGGAESRLALVEFLLREDDLGACAQRVLEWLERHARIHKALCLATDPEGKRLVTVASQGVSPLEAADFWLEVEDRGHPLIKALSREDAVRFSPGARQPLTPIGAETFFAVPLGKLAPEQPAQGLLLVAGPDVARSPNLGWVAEALSEKLRSLRSWHLAGESRFGRERALLHGVINAVTDPILLTDTDGRLIIANVRAENLFATQEDDSEGRRRAVGMNNMLFSAALAGRAMDTNESVRHELLLVDPEDGSDLLFELMSQPVREPGGEMGIVSVLRNVTDLGRASAEIGENQQKLQQVQAQVESERDRLDVIIDSVADPIVVTDASGDIVLMNQPAERLFTLMAEATEEAQRRVRSNDAHFSSFVSGLLFSGEARRVRDEITLVDPQTGEELPVEAVAGKILSERGELTTVVTILHDRREALEKAKLYEQLKRFSDELEGRVQSATAELAEQNELLRRQAIALEQASAAKSQFLANMSHEFRTPLNAILGYTSMLLQGVSGSLAPPQAKNLTRIDSNARHLLEVINEILDITRIESGRMPLKLTTFKVEDLVKEVLSELDPIIQRSGLQVSSKIAPGMPALRTDRQKVKQILVNLLGNALKFTHQGSIRIDAHAEGRGRLAHLAVVDSGIGIAPEYHAQIFEDFRQVDSSTTRAYGGTGLGLSICKRLADMLDGRIDLASELGKGSTFTLVIPVKARRR